MATVKQPKSILKKKRTAYPAIAKEERDREKALYHAQIIQRRKDVELEILLSTELLIDYPLSNSPYDASNPSPVDTTNFKKLLRPFQPADYDALILERNINEHCGYTLCPNQRLKVEGSGRYRLLGTNGKAKDFRVVEKAELEKWCSEQCARRALYIRVQLNETPAWERGSAGSCETVDLLDEPKFEDLILRDQVTSKVLGRDHETTSTKDNADLAIERGEMGRRAPGGFVDVDIQHNDLTRPAEAPSLEYEDLNNRLGTLHLALEGYTSTFDGQNQRIVRDEEDHFTDWKI